MPTAISHDVKVKVNAFFHHQQSGVGGDEYLFLYHIEIENHGEHTVQLISRHWEIFDSMTDWRSVDGEGVVGVQPILEPGEQYEYVSSCLLLSELGKMLGYYTFIRNLDQKSFEVIIPEFTLICPWRLN